MRCNQNRAQKADRVLRSIEQNHGELSNVLAKEIPVLGRPGAMATLLERDLAQFGVQVPFGPTPVVGGLSGLDELFAPFKGRSRVACAVCGRAGLKLACPGGFR